VNSAGECPEYYLGCGLINGICDPILGASKLFLDIFKDFQGFSMIFEDLCDALEAVKRIWMLGTSNARILGDVGCNIKVFKVVFAMCDQFLRIFEIFEDFKMLLDENHG
jgi:hypothetical protein